MINLQTSLFTCFFCSPTLTPPESCDRLYRRMMYGGHMCSPYRAPHFCACRQARVVLSPKHQGDSISADIGYLMDTALPKIWILLCVQWLGAASSCRLSHCPIVLKEHFFVLFASLTCRFRVRGPSRCYNLKMGCYLLHNTIVLVG